MKSFHVLSASWSYYNKHTLFLVAHLLHVPVRDVPSLCLALIEKNWLELMSAELKTKLQFDLMFSRNSLVPNT